MYVYMEMLINVFVELIKYANCWTKRMKTYEFNRVNCVLTILRVSPIPSIEEAWWAAPCTLKTARVPYLIAFYPLHVKRKWNSIWVAVLAGSHSKEKVHALFITWSSVHVVVAERFTILSTQRRHFGSLVNLHTFGVMGQRRLFMLGKETAFDVDSLQYELTRVLS